VRVGVLTTSYPRDDADYAGWFVADRVRALAAAGHEVEVIAGGAISGTTRDGRVSVTRLPATFAGATDLFAGAGAPESLERGGLPALWAAARFTTSLSAEVRARARRWDRVESHWLVPCGLAALAAAQGVPHRATAHSGDVALLERWPFGASIARLLAASGAELVFVSENLRRRFAALAGRVHGVVALAAGVAPAGRGPALDRARLGISRPTVIAVGRLVPIKGFDLLVRACARRAGETGPLSLVLVGDGPERERLRRLADRLGVPLTLAGTVPRTEVPSWLALGDIYAQPSRVLPNGRAEGMPLSTLEALASGLPAVVSDSGGLAELGGREGVQIVPAGDTRALAAALRVGLSACEVSVNVA
jgi:glycosyltransferase involved in cell wall biosynthesis